MPSDIVTPVQLDWAGGSLTTSHDRDVLTPARLSWRGGSLTTNFSGTSLSVTTPQLDRLTRFDGMPDRFMLIWQQAMEAIESAFEALTTQVADNSAIIARLVAAEDLAQAANDNATTAVNTVDLANSYTNPVGVGSASSAGVVTVSAHERVYGDGTTVNVNAGSVSGFAPGDYVTVYYVDAARAGGAVTYQGTTGAVSQTGSTHIVWQGSIPDAGQPDAPGSGPTAPGYTPPLTPTYDPRLIEYEQGV